MRLGESCCECLLVFADNDFPVVRVFAGQFGWFVIDPLLPLLVVQAVSKRLRKLIVIVSDADGETW